EDPTSHYSVPPFRALSFSLKDSCPLSDTRSRHRGVQAIDKRRKKRGVGERGGPSTTSRRPQASFAASRNGATSTTIPLLVVGPPSLVPRPAAGALLAR